MGMDVYGLAPSNELGRKFECSIYVWRPLFAFVSQYGDLPASIVADVVKDDAAVLSAEQTKRLAENIDRAIRSGAAALWVEGFERARNATPEEICSYCDGTGIRRDRTGIEMEFNIRRINEPEHPRFGQVGWCNGCDGRGKRAPPSTNYFVRLDHIEEFRDFITTCGGCRIGV